MRLCSVLPLPSQKKSRFFATCPEVMNKRLYSCAICYSFLREEYEVYEKPCTRRSIPNETAFMQRTYPYE